MKLILQHDERDCGAACFAMISDHYGYSQSLNHFREMTSTSQDGTSAYYIKKAAEGLGLSSDVLSGSIKELSDSIRINEIRLPFIAQIITEDNYCHFIVVSSFSEDKIGIFDPANGKKIVTIEEFADSWTGNIINIVPTASFKKGKVKKKGLSAYYRLLKGQIREFFLIIILSLIISGIGIGAAFAFQLIIDHSSEIAIDGSDETADHHDHHKHEIEYLTDSKTLNNILEKASDYFESLTIDSISSIFLSLIILYAIAAMIQYIRSRLIITMSQKIDLGISIPYFDKIMDLPVSSIQKRRTGDYMSRYSDSTAIRNVISTATITLIIDTIMAIGCSMILYFQNHELFTIVAIIMLLYTLIVLGNRKRIKKANNRFMEQSAYVQSSMKENIDAAETIKALNAEEQTKKNMNSAFGAYIEAAVRKSRITMTQDSIVAGIETIGISVILWKGFYLVAQGNMTLGSLITFYALLGYLITPVKNLIDVQPALQSGIVSAERLNDIMEMKSEESSGENMELLDPINSWEMKDISFHYGLQDNLLDNINIKFNKGEHIAIIGKSGCGKTTLAKLFTEMYEPETGHIYADGTDIRSYSVKSLRNTVQYVSGTPNLFSGTLKDNILFGNTDCSEQDISTICKITGVDTLINSFPGGESFMIEEGGSNLSTGQKQRIAITRALLKHPQMLILDEASSNLDSETEIGLFNKIKELSPDMILLVISHRTSAIKGFDRIIEIKDGKADEIINHPSSEY